MSDYDRFIDFAAIKSCDHAFAKRQYNVSTFLYDIALKKLMHYNGDSMFPIQLAGGLKEKLQDSSLALARRPEQIPLRYRTWKLSKTAFVQGKQCLKQLYLEKYRKEEKTAPDPDTIALWNKGREFEDKVRKKMFPAGIDVKDAMASKWNYFCSYTHEMLRKYSEIDLFEATIIEDDILIMIDMLHQTKDKKLDLFEIKLNSELTEGILWDLSLQYYVAKKSFGDRIRTFNVVLRKGEKSWQIIDVKDRLEEKLKDTGATGKEFLEFLKDPVEPKIAMGAQCDLPYSCSFKDYCSKSTPNSNDFQTL